MSVEVNLPAFIFRERHYKMQSNMNETEFIERLRNEAESLKFNKTKRCDIETESLETKESNIDFLTFKALRDSLKSLEVHRYQNEVLIRMTRHFSCKEISERRISQRAILMLLVSLVKSNVGHLWKESNLCHLEMFAIVYHMFLQAMPPVQSLQSLSILSCHSHGIQMPEFFTRNITFTSLQGLCQEKEVFLNIDMTNVPRSLPQGIDFLKFKLLYAFSFSENFMHYTDKIDISFENFLILEDENETRHAEELQFFWLGEECPNLHEQFSHITHTSYLTNTATTTTIGQDNMPDKRCWKITIFHPFDSLGTRSLIKEFQNILSSKTHYHCLHGTALCYECINFFSGLHALKRFVWEELSFQFEQQLELDEFYQ